MVKDFVALAFDAQERYITIATLTTSYTFNWSPPTERALVAPFLVSTPIFSTSIISITKETRKPSCEKKRNIQILGMK